MEAFYVGQRTENTACREKSVLFLLVPAFVSCHEQLQTSTIRITADRDLSDGCIAI
jgi:hypothetical protein